MKSSGTLQQRFNAGLERTSDGCWLWRGYCAPNGYGHVRRGGSGGGQMMSTHRVSFELHIGPIPDGQWVLHRCDVRNCVNPDHLFLGSRRDNIDDMKSKGRSSTCGVYKHSSKISSDQIAQIRSVVMKRGVRKRLAEEFGVTTRTINRLRVDL